MVTMIIGSLGIVGSLGPFRYLGECMPAVTSEGREKHPPAKNYWNTVHKKSSSYLGCCKSQLHDLHHGGYPGGGGALGLTFRLGTGNLWRLPCR
jgi:hypothetical protein